MVFSEETWVLERQKQDVAVFLETMKQVDREQGHILEKEGWIYKETAERRILFTFGDVLLNRRCYMKEGKRCYPVDDFLGLTPYSKISPYLLYQMATTAVDLSFRKAAIHFQELLYLDINKDMVAKARKYVTKLYKEKEEYRFLKEEEQTPKRKVKTLYIEGDGLMISTPDAEDGTRKTDFAHFLIHEGIEQEYGQRGRAINKHEIWFDSNRDAREQVLDYLHNHYELTEETLLITNSDMGHGYTPHAFQEIAKVFPCKHEHFWDRYHLDKKISEMMKAFPVEYEEELFRAVAKHDKGRAHAILDSAAGLIENDPEFEEQFERFKIKLLHDFAYTKLPELRGLSSVGIGIMESNHTKLTYRMKKQARHWSRVGALTMGRMIIDKVEGRLKDLFFGSWRVTYQHHKAIEQMSVSQFLKKAPSNQGIKQVRQANKSGRRRY